MFPSTFMLTLTEWGVWDNFLPNLGDFFEKSEKHDFWEFAKKKKKNQTNL